MVGLACERIRLPDPREVIVAPVLLQAGVPAAAAFPRLRRKDGSERKHAHVVVVFDESARGPALLRAGRYRGYGVCRPMFAAEPPGNSRRRAIGMTSAPPLRCDQAFACGT
jgi:CRISPR-associated protein Csb2